MLWVKCWCWWYFDDTRFALCMSSVGAAGRNLISSGHKRSLNNVGHKLDASVVGTSLCLQSFETSQRNDHEVSLLTSNYYQILKFVH